MSLQFLYCGKTRGMQKPEPEDLQETRLHDGTSIFQRQNHMVGVYGHLFLVPFFVTNFSIHMEKQGGFLVETDWKTRGFFVTCKN